MDNSIKGASSLSSVQNVSIKTINYGPSASQKGSTSFNMPSAALETISINYTPKIGMDIPNYAPGYYGADQATMVDRSNRQFLQYITFGIVKYTDFDKRHDQMCKQIMERYNVKGTSNQASVLSIIKEQGCGLSTMANVIVDYYKNKPEEFEKIYGYPLYDTTSDGFKVPNYDYLLVDIFLRNNTGRTENFSVETAEYEEFLQKAFPGVSVSVKFCARDITIDTYKNAMLSGQYEYAAIAVKDFKLLPVGDNPKKKYYNKGGHFMTITGISESGNFIVSSWGYEWELVGGTPYDNTQDGGLFLIDVASPSLMVGGN